MTLRLPGRVHAEELMDVEPVEDADLARCLRDLERVNIASLGYRPTLRWLDRLAAGREALSVLDVGCGGGDLLRRIAVWSRRRGVAATLTGLDINPSAIRAATAATDPALGIRYVAGDLFDWPGGGRIDEPARQGTAPSEPGRPAATEARRASLTGDGPPLPGAPALYARPGLGRVDAPAGPETAVPDPGPAAAAEARQASVAADGAPLPETAALPATGAAQVPVPVPVPEAERVDVIVSSLFAHHLPNEDLVRFFRWMEARARLGWIVNDLHRHPVSYWGLRAILAVAPVHRFVRHDGPVSVRRGFSRADLEAVGRAAGFAPGDLSIEWWFPFRWGIGRRIGPA